MTTTGVLLLVVALTWTATTAFPGPVQNARNSRIVSGWEAEEGQFPHQLSLRTVNPTGSVFACGGSLIHSQFGLTAAHCTAGQVSLVIRAGAVSLTRPAVIFETTDYFNHPDFNDDTPTVVQTNDISIIKFNRAIQFSDLIRPIRLQASQDKDKDYDGATLQVSGWGRTWTNGASPDILNWVYLRGISNVACRQAYGNSPIIADTTICAAYYNVTSQSICQGDNGGALIVPGTDGVPVQVGIASFVSDAGCHVGFPAGFVRPGYFHEWLTEVTGVDFDWDPNVTTEAPETPTTPAPPTTETTINTEADGVTSTAAPTQEPESEENGESEEGEESEESEEGEESEESDESEEGEESEEGDESEGDEESDE